MKRIFFLIGDGLRPEGLGPAVYLCVLGWLLYHRISGKEDARTSGTPRAAFWVFSIAAGAECCRDSPDFRFLLLNMAALTLPLLLPDCLRPASAGLRSSGNPSAAAGGTGSGATVPEKFRPGCGWYAAGVWTGVLLLEGFRLWGIGSREMWMWICAFLPVAVALFPLAAGFVPDSSRAGSSRAGSSGAGKSGPCGSGGLCSGGFGSDGFGSGCPGPSGGYPGPRAEGAAPAGVREWMLSWTVLFSAVLYAAVSLASGRNAHPGCIILWAATVLPVQLCCIPAFRTRLCAALGARCRKTAGGAAEAVCRKAAGGRNGDAEGPGPDYPMSGGPPVGATDEHSETCGTEPAGGLPPAERKRSPYLRSRGKERTGKYAMREVFGLERSSGLLEEEGDEDMTIIRRLVQHFEKDKPYLSPDLKIGEVALQIYTNKTYLSRALNRKLAKNFNQFVNCFRIREACRLFLTAPELRAQDLCDRSGFNSTSSFCTAFRINTGYSPAEWCKEVKCKLKNDEPVLLEEYF